VTERSRIVPAGAPKAVEQVRNATLELKARIPETRRAIEDAKAELALVERADREAMAAALRAGCEARSDAGAVERAKAGVSAAERRLEALQLAIADSELALADVARRARAAWLKTCQRREADARGKGRDALERLQASLDDLRLARTTSLWLSPDGGLDRARPAPRGLRRSLSSARAQKNDSPLSIEQLLEWVAEALEPPPPNVVVHGRDEWPALGARAS
jgi:hypothetical protein